MGRQLRTPLKFFLRLALKNLSRYRRRTMITAAAIAGGVAVFAAVASVMDGFNAESDRNFIDYELGSARITGEGYWEEKDQYPLDILVEDADGIIAELDASGIAAAGRTEFKGELIIRYDPFPEDGNIPMVFTGADPERDPNVFKLKEAIEEGRFLQPGEDEIIIGRWLAESIGAEVGYPVTVITRTRDGFYQIMDLEIAGIYNTPNPHINRNVAYIPLDTADYYLEMQNAVTSIMVSGNERVPGTFDISPIERMLEGRPLDILSFQAMTAEFAEIMDMSEQITNVILLLLAVIAVVGISNTMLMAVLEREREIGMMRALGMKDSEIRWMFIFEASGIGAIGALIGIAFGSVLMWLLSTYGIDYGAMLGDIDMGYRFSEVLYGIWSFSTLITASLVAVVVSGIVSVIPVRRMLKKRAADCLRHA